MTHPTLAPVDVTAWRPPHADPHTPCDHDAQDADLIATLSPKRYLVGNAPRLFYSLGDLARVLGRSPVTIRKWIRLGILPETPFKYTTPDIRGSRRLFTEGMIAGVLKIARAEGILPLYAVANLKHTNFTPRVVDLYERELLTVRVA